jgi:hypothetical protein
MGLSQSALAAAAASALNGQRRLKSKRLKLQWPKNGQSAKNALRANLARPHLIHGQQNQAARCVRNPHRVAITRMHQYRQAIGTVPFQASSAFPRSNPFPRREGVSSQD